MRCVRQKKESGRETALLLVLKQAACLNPAPHCRASSALVLAATMRQPCVESVVHVCERICCGPVGGAGPHMLDFHFIPVMSAILQPPRA